jgi:hypothetical protein
MAGRVYLETNNLDVLLRHRLPPQPGGFEGFGLRPHSAPPDDLSVAHVGDVPHRQLDGRVALPATAVLAQSRDRHLSELAHLLDLAAEVGVDVEEAPVPAPDTVVALEGVAALPPCATRRPPLRDRGARVWPATQMPVSRHHWLVPLLLTFAALTTAGCGAGVIAATAARGGLSARRSA